MSELTSAELLERTRMALHDIGENPDAAWLTDDGRPLIRTDRTVDPRVSDETAWRVISTIKERFSGCFACSVRSQADDCTAERKFVMDCGRAR